LSLARITNASIISKIEGSEGAQEAGKGVRVGCMGVEVGGLAVLDGSGVGFSWDALPQLDK
jgi:hypothetical protein